MYLQERFSVALGRHMFLLLEHAVQLHSEQTTHACCSCCALGYLQYGQSIGLKVGSLKEPNNSRLHLMMSQIRQALGMRAARPEGH